MVTMPAVQVEELREATRLAIADRESMRIQLAEVHSKVEAPNAQACAQANMLRRQLEINQEMQSQVQTIDQAASAAEGASDGRQGQQNPQLFTVHTPATSDVGASVSKRFAGGEQVRSRVMEIAFEQGRTTQEAEDKATAVHVALEEAKATLGSIQSTLWPMNDPSLGISKSFVDIRGSNVDNGKANPEFGDMHRSKKPRQGSPA